MQKMKTPLPIFLIALVVFALACNFRAEEPLPTLAPTLPPQPTRLNATSTLAIMTTVTPPPTAQPSPAPSLTPAPTSIPLTHTPTSVKQLLKVNPPPAGQLYHGVFPGTSGAIDDPRNAEEDGMTLADLRLYEKAVGKTARWVYFSHNWFKSRSFPTSTAKWIRDAGSIPYVRMLMWSQFEENKQETLFTTERIAKGEFDNDLRAWARGARDFGTPILAEYGVEVNGEWFPWNGKWAGGGITNGYGDPNVPDGPERFRDAYRRIIRLSREEGATNITWVFHINYMDVPNETWNRFENYYPGDEWIDWLGVSVYGAQAPNVTDWFTFRELMDAIYPRLAALSPNKPIVINEFGVAANNPRGDQAVWAEAALKDITSFRWQQVIGFSWLNEQWQNDSDPTHDTIMVVQKNPALAKVFQKYVGANPNVLGAP